MRRRKFTRVRKKKPISKSRPLVKRPMKALKAKKIPSKKNRFKISDLQGKTRNIRYANYFNLI